ncbi:hypothetical protein IHE45_08G111500 [Dioscorea alata]|uniref:Uncharacterized protein n=1 Tax=Dioscorea alata TaxID=55571 RepID=A0ACB7VM24_DIOAL|nr:hypothetical protein IHE45_08G111500 [Dioscorea alata]
MNDRCSLVPRSCHIEVQEDNFADNFLFSSTQDLNHKQKQRGKKKETNMLCMNGRITFRNMVEKDGSGPKLHF